MGPASPVYLVDGARTPFLRYQGEPGPMSAADMAVAASQALLMSYPQLETKITQSIWGCVSPAANEMNIARLIALRLGLPLKTSAYTVQRNCASGMQAVASGMDRITQGEDVVLCGGVEVMSRAPLLFSPAMVKWLSAWRTARGPLQRLRCLTQFRPRLLRPIVALQCALTDPTVDLTMGQTAEYLAAEFGISRSADHRSTIKYDHHLDADASADSAPIDSW